MFLRPVFQRPLFLMILLVTGPLYFGHSQKLNAVINIDNGLVNNEITAIVQDKKGFMWFGTRGGLHKYDGYEIKLLKNDMNVGNNLLSQSIEVLLNGADNNLWIGTKSGGLSMYDFTTGQLINYHNNHASSRLVNSDYVLSIYEASNRYLYVGTWRGFLVLDKTSRRFTILNTNWKTYDIKPDGKGGMWVATGMGLNHFDPTSKTTRLIDLGFPQVDVTSILPDSAAHCLWLGTWRRGLIRYDLETRTAKQFNADIKDKEALGSNNVYRIFKDSRGIIWVGTWGGGLHSFNPETGLFERVPLNITSYDTRDDKIIISITEDISGLLWVGTDGAGICKLDPGKKKFYNITYDPRLPQPIDNNHVLTVLTDRNNNLWVGTRGGGVQVSSDWQHFTTLPVPDAAKEDRYNIKVVKCFLEEGDHIWMGSNGGLTRIVYRDKTAVVKTFAPNRNPASLPGKKISALVKDYAGTVWVGTQEFGLSKITGYDSENAPIFKKYPPLFGTKGALQNERISCMFVDSKKRLWVGTYKGLHLYNYGADNFTCFGQTADEQHSLSNNTILSMAEDKLGNIWVGTQFGLNKITGMDSGRLVVKRFTTKEGLPNDYIHGIQADDKNRIWVSTNRGICRINPDQAISVFDKRDGVQSSAFSENASFKSAGGLLLFGGVEGVSYFKPDSIHISHFTPPLYFTNLRINNTLYEFGKSQPEGIILSKPFYESNSISLNYKQNIISIDFASLDYHAPDKNEYTYMLEGFNREWVMAGNKRTVSYTNLEPGNYTFKIKASNSDKVWNTETRLLQLRVLPPPWKTWWAYCIYTLIFALLLWYSRYLGLKQVRLTNKLQLVEVAHKQEQELTQFKTKLFTNISHEFRTPLTLILGPIDDLLRKNTIDPPVKKSIRLVQKQSKRLLRMVNQLLDFQKAEAGSLRLNGADGEVVSFVEEIFSLFNDEAQRKNIEYKFIFNQRFISLTFDADKLEIIVYNLLSNAFKFTPAKGSITLAVNRCGDACEISVTDTGIGISDADKERIFDRFYQGKKMDATNISGTGIGLSFVKELTELHGGSIRVESDGIAGSSFIIRLPLNTKPAPNGTIKSQTLYQTGFYESTQNLPNMNTPNEHALDDLPIILVVEDDPDVNDYVCDILSAEYTVVSAADGKEGLEKAFELIPDIIVSDVMMPEVDGIELCRIVKSDAHTSHIPVILLTALNDTTHHIKGIREGADVYLPKPFNSQLLLVHVHNLISTRQKLKEIYAKKIFLEPVNLEISSHEESFLADVIKLIEENISNTDFHNDELAYAMNMSRSTFYRKLKAVAGISGTEFIRLIRLKFASKLLMQGGHTVNEAAYDSGFNDIKYFRKCFSEQFGVNPSEYKNQAKA